MIEFRWAGKKFELEAELFKIIDKFERETPYAVTKIVLIRSADEPVLSKVWTVVKM
jgi:hypothetical protein